MENKLKSPIWDDVAGSAYFQTSQILPESELAACWHRVHFRIRAGNVIAVADEMTDIQIFDIPQESQTVFSFTVGIENFEFGVASRSEMLEVTLQLGQVGIVRLQEIQLAQLRAE